MNSPTWDRVAVKFSYDNGLSWTQPVPIIVNGLPSNYQRPFDPAIVYMTDDSLRLFFSSSDGMPPPGGDSIINTYSANTTDGINYTFEPGARYDNPTQRVIDPSAVIYNGEWHYVAPIGAPQDGAYHCWSLNGINFIQLMNIVSDPQHNWTGNFLVDHNSNELRFYGSGPQIWYNTSDGTTWFGYVNTNVTGGDPSVIQSDSNSFIMIFVGEPYLSTVNEIERSISVYPNPVKDYLILDFENKSEIQFEIYSLEGKRMLSRIVNKTIDVSGLPAGYYFLYDQEKLRRIRFLKE